MRNRHQAATFFAHHRQQLVVQRFLSRFIQCAGGFVSKYPTGSLQQHTRQGQALLLSTRELLRPMAGDIQIVHQVGQQGVVERILQGFISVVLGAAGVGQRLAQRALGEVRRCGMNALPSGNTTGPKVMGSPRRSCVGEVT